MTELHQDICSATWWDSKLFNALIRPKLWLETPRWLSHAAPTTTRSIHQPNGLYIFNPCNLSGWGSVMRGERRIKFPVACFSSTGKPLIHGLSSFSHHSFSLLSFPITPCCCGPPFSVPFKHPYLFYQDTFIFPPHSLWMFSAPHSSPVFPLQHLPLFFFHL